jgi:hypothetical protein
MELGADLCLDVAAQAQRACMRTASTSSRPRRRSTSAGICTMDEQIRACSQARDPRAATSPSEIPYTAFSATVRADEEREKVMPASTRFAGRSRWVPSREARTSSSRRSTRATAALRLLISSRRTRPVIACISRRWPARAWVWTERRRAICSTRARARSRRGPSPRTRRSDGWGRPRGARACGRSSKSRRR